MVLGFVGSTIEISLWGHNKAKPLFGVAKLGLQPFGTDMATKLRPGAVLCRAAQAGGALRVGSVLRPTDTRVGVILHFYLCKRPARRVENGLYPALLSPYTGHIRVRIMLIYHLGSGILRFANISIRIGLWGHNKAKPLVWQQN